MFATVYNIVNIRRWQERRRRIQALSGPERRRILQCFSDDIRALLPAVARATTVGDDDIDRAMKTIDIYSVVIGAWLALDPTNTDWPGRDRLFVSRRDDLICACSALSSFGFFPAGQMPDLVEEAELHGSLTIIPGLEQPGVPGAEIPELVWESAQESARNKRRWRDHMEKISQSAWVDSHWAAAPESWRTCIVLDSTDPITLTCRNLPVCGGDAPAGLLALIKAPDNLADTIAEDWWNSGWDAMTLKHNDPAQLYEVLATTHLHRPLAIVLTMDNAAGTTPYISKTFTLRRESGLLGEMSDEQFNAIIGQSLELSD